MKIFTSTEDFRKSEDIESVDGEMVHHSYGVEDVLKFIENQGKRLNNISDTGRTIGYELLQAIHPEMRIDKKILAKLFELGGQELFEEIKNHTTLLYDNDFKKRYNVYNGAIRGVRARINEVEERICEEKINQSDDEIIEKLEEELNKEEIWQAELISKREEILPKIIQDKKQYNLDGYEIKSFIHKDTGTRYNLKGFDINNIHKDTGTRYNSRGFDINNIHKDTGTRYNPEGFDINNIHKDTGTKYNPEGYDIERI